MVCDVRELRGDQVTGRADLCWLSPPSQDASAAGPRSGLVAVVGTLAAAAYRISVEAHFFRYLYQGSSLLVRDR